MGAIASQITSITIVQWTVYSDADERKHQSSVSLAFVWGIHRGPVNSPHKWPVTRKMFPFHDVIMKWYQGRISHSVYEHLIQNAFCCNFYSDDKIMPQICTRHDSLAIIRSIYIYTYSLWNYLNIRIFMLTSCAGMCDLPVNFRQ